MNALTRRSLLAAAGLWLAATLACSGSGDSGSSLAGTVHDPSGSGITGATVTVGGASAITQSAPSAGQFQMNAPSGLQTLTASKPGYQTVSSKVIILPGRNNVDLMLEPGIGPTPTPTGPYDVTGRFNGVASTSTTNPLPAWLGSSVVFGSSSFPRRVFGMQGIGGECAYVECDSSCGSTITPLNAGDPPSKIACCQIGWGAAGQGTTGPLGCGNDAMVQLVVVSAGVWNDGSRIKVQDPGPHPSTPAYFRYMEGTLTASNCGFQVGAPASGCTATATSGYINLARSGFVGGAFSYSAPVVASNGYFYVPGLP